MGLVLLIVTLSILGEDGALRTSLPQIVINTGTVASTESLENLNMKLVISVASVVLIVIKKLYNILAVLTGAWLVEQVWLHISNDFIEQPAIDVVTAWSVSNC